MNFLCCCLYFSCILWKDRKNPFVFYPGKSRLPDQFLVFDVSLKSWTLLKWQSHQGYFFSSAVETATVDSRLKEIADLKAANFDTTAVNSSALKVTAKVLWNEYELILLCYFFPDLFDLLTLFIISWLK